LRRTKETADAHPGGEDGLIPGIAPTARLLPHPQPVGCGNGQDPGKVGLRGVGDHQPRRGQQSGTQKEASRIEQTSPEAQTIKYADIIDNCKEITIQDPEFAWVFLSECKMLLRKMPQGNEELYKKAMETVEGCLRQVPREFRTSKKDWH
jgi:hypothetical protein